MTAWTCDKIPPPRPIKAQFGLELITCTPRHKIHVVYHTGQTLHYSRIRSFKIPTIPSPITTSLHNKTSLNIIFTQFCILLSHQTLIKTKFQPLIFCVCFAGLIFAIGELFILPWIDFCDFPEAAFYLEL